MRAGLVVAGIHSIAEASSTLCEPASNATNEFDLRRWLPARELWWRILRLRARDDTVQAVTDTTK